MAGSGGLWAGFSGVTITQEVIWADDFGRLSFGRVRSLVYLVTFGFGAVRPIAMNAVFDILGSCLPAFPVIAGLFVLAALMIARPPAKTAVLRPW